MPEPEQALTALHESGHLDRERSRRLMAMLAAHHAERFGEPADPSIDERREALKALRERFENQRRDIEARMTEACLLLEEHARLLGDATKEEDPEDRER